MDEVAAVQETLRMEERFPPRLQRIAGVAIIKNGTIYKKTLQQAMVQFFAIDRSVDLLVSCDRDIRGYGDLT